MRIVIDLQGAQSPGSRNRGIGRYSLSLALAIARNRNDHEIIIALSGLFPNTIEPIRANFHGLLPAEKILVWNAPSPVDCLSPENQWNRQSAELIREAFLANLNPDVVLISSLFEGLSDDAVTSVGAFSNEIPTVAILYDLIPYINRDPYLNNPTIEQWYENKISHLCRADFLLSISESSRQEGIEYLAIPPCDITNISTAADAQFVELALTDTEKQELLQRYALEHEYVMYTGGIDYRKNIEGLIRAYASLPSTLREQHQLAIVCSIQSADRQRLAALIADSGLHSTEVVLTGFIPEDDLIKLYNLCKVFIFPSKHEGFGLPALEAMHCGCPVIGSNTSSLPEVIGCSEALFDPNDDASIADKLEQVLTDDDFRQQLTTHSKTQAKVFSWDNSAKKALVTLEEFLAEKAPTAVTATRTNRRPLLAYISPLPPERSGISDYSAQLLPELSRYYKIDVVVTQQNVADSYISANFTLRTEQWLINNADRYDRVLYHFGNSQFHQHMFGLIEQVPGVIVLHDFYLSGIISYMDAHGYSPNFLASELYKSHGYQSISECFSSTDVAEVIYQYPCNLTALQNAQGIIIHSENSRRLAKYWYGSDAANNWINIPLLRKIAHNVDKQQARKALNIAADDFVICTFGILALTKLNHRLLSAWLKSKLAKEESCQLIFVGQNDAGKYGESLLKTIQDSGLSSRVNITGWTDTETFHQYLAAADIGVQLRAQSRGETSAAVLDCMNFALPTIVNANGSLQDLSADSVLRISDNFDDSELSSALESLWSNKELRTTIGRTSQQLIQKQHSPRHCAELYFSAIEQFNHQSEIAVPSLIKSITQLDPPPKNSERWKNLARDIDRSIPLQLARKKLLVDVSGLIQSGPQHKVYQRLHDWLVSPSMQYRIEPIYTLKGEYQYRYARNFTLALLDCPANILPDDIASYATGDVFFELSPLTETDPTQTKLSKTMREIGVVVVPFKAVHATNLDNPIQVIIEQLIK